MGKSSDILCGGMAVTYEIPKRKRRPSLVREQLSLLLRAHQQLDLLLLDEPRTLADFTDGSYAAVENKHVGQFVRKHRTPDRSYNVGAFSRDIAAGKNTYVYDAHTYHTKVPPEAIRQLVEHYTQPGDLVLDSFCGSGMTGVAALQSRRKAILSDLSPAATFIALNFMTPVVQDFMQVVNEVLTQTQQEEIALYGTHCRTCRALIPMEYMVWSYGLVCQSCGKEFVLWDVARDEQESVRESKIRSEFDCPHCDQHLAKRALRRTKLYPVQVGYRCCKSGLTECKASPDEFDLAVIGAAELAALENGLWHPTAEFPNGVNTRQAIAHGLTSVDKLYTSRNLRAMARLWDIARRWPNDGISLKLMFAVTSLYQRVTKLSEFRFWGGSGNIANYNVPMIFNEQNVFKVFRRKAKTIRDYLEMWQPGDTSPFCISTQSATDVAQIPNDSLDYIFTDPPFGANINYSEMNYLWESWLDVFTDTTHEAIVNRVQGKTLDHYRRLIARSLREMYRVLKPGRWLTLVFHNSSAVVWASIQQALHESGFSLVRTQALDKQHGTFKQFVSENAVGYDLMLHCQKSVHGTVSTMPSKTKPTSESALRAFMARTLAAKPDGFVVRYLHVKRRDEFDYRRLYSLWLKELVESGKTIDLNFEEFRKTVARILTSTPRQEA